MMSLIFFSPVSKVLDIQTYRHGYAYRHGWLYYLVQWLFFLSATDFEFFTNIWADWVRNLSFRKTSLRWLWIHRGMLSDSVLKMMQKDKGIFFRMLLYYSYLGIV
jgi:hypothetical protein